MRAFESRSRRLSAAGLVLLLALRAHAAVPAPGALFGESARASIGHAPGALAVGDLDHDGRVDVVVVNSDSTMTTLLGDGAGGLGAPRDFHFGKDVTGLALGDVDGDGRLDAAV